MTYNLLKISFCSTSGAYWLLADNSTAETGTLTEAPSLVATAIPLIMSKTRTAMLYGYLTAPQGWKIQHSGSPTSASLLLTI